MQLTLDNLPPDVTADSLRALLAELGIPAPRELVIAPGLRNKPSALLSLDVEHADMEAIVKLLDGRYWQGHVMHASHTALFR